MQVSISYTQLQQLRKQAATGGSREPVIPLPAYNPTQSSATYTVQKNDTLWDLSKKWNTTVKDIADTNGLANPNNLRIGQTLTIPGRPQPAAAPVPSTPQAPYATSTITNAAKTLPTASFDMNNPVYSKYKGYFPDDNLLQAIAIVESSNGANRVGDNGNSIGAYQIRKTPGKDVSPVIADVNSTFNTNYTLADRNDDVKAAEIVKLYLARYSRHFYRTHGRMPTRLELARMWNGGPSGYNKDVTKAYGDRIQAAEKRLGAYPYVPAR